MKVKEFGDQPSGTACLLRLCKPWFGSGRTVLGDSAFASVNSAVTLSGKGLFFSGPVKTATTLFPMPYFNALPSATRGSHVTLTSTHNGVKLIATAWDDHTRKCLISTAGTSLDATPAQRTRYRSLTSPSQTYMHNRAYMIVLVVFYASLVALWQARMEWNPNPSWSRQRDRTQWPNSSTT
jgi:hypothetical protein